MAASLSSFDVAKCVDRCRFATGCCETHCHGCMNVAWAMFWGKSRRTKPCVFPCKVAAAGDEREHVWLRRGSFHARSVPPMCFATSCCSCVPSAMRFLHLWLQIALEWLLHCSHLMLPRAIGAGLLRDAAKRIVMAASRLLGAATACVILLSFAAEHRKSYRNGCIHAAIVIC